MAYVLTQYHIETIPLLSAEEVASQIQTASAAQPLWGKSSFETRQSVLRSLKAWVLGDMDGIVRVACRDTGKTSEYGLSRYPDCLTVRQEWMQSSGKS